MFKAFAAAGLEFVSIGLLALTGVHPELLDLPVSLAILLRCHRLCALGGNDFRPSGIGSSGVPESPGPCPWLTASPASDLPPDAADVVMVAENRSWRWQSSFGLRSFLSDFGLGLQIASKDSKSMSSRIQTLKAKDLGFRTSFKVDLQGVGFKT